MNHLALVIENDLGTRRLLHVLLARLGLEVDLVANGNDALLLLERVEYDVIFMDLMIPGPSGSELLAWMAAARLDMLGRTVVLSSAAPRVLDQVRQSWPTVRAIRKPFELTEITEAAALATSQLSRRSRTTDEEFLRRSVRAGAKAGVILQSDGTTLNAISSYGYTAPQIEAFMPLHLDSPFPICSAARHRRPVWLASVTLAAAEYPMLAPVWKKNESRALAAVPLLRDDVLLGAVGWSFREPRAFSEDEQETFLSIAQLVNAALMQPNGTQQHSTRA
jgi:CheY-like chemotaxis protein